jgi:hypothetical protein
LVACIGLTGSSLAQSDGSSQAVDPTVAKQLDDAVRDYFSHPELLTRAREPARTGRIARLLEGVRVEFKAFQPNDDGDLALGFAYDIAKSLTVSNDSDASLDFIADGNVAFDQAENPNDFLWTSVRARWAGGPAFGSASHDARQQLVAEPSPPTAEQLAMFQTQLSDAAAAGERGDAAKSKAFEELSRSHVGDLARTLPSEFVWDFDLHAGLESTQDFSSRQWVFGPALSGRLVSWNPDTKLSRYNVFDFPGAALRWLCGEDEHFRPSGLAYPTVCLGIDMVNASDDDIRTAVTSDESLLRTRVEAGLSTHVIDVADEALFLSASWCAYQEIDAPSGVRDADYDRSSFFELCMDLPSHWKLTYTAGRLPLDDADDSTFGLGFEVRF